MLFTLKSEEELLIAVLLAPLANLVSHEQIVAFRKFGGYPQTVLVRSADTAGCDNSLRPRVCPACCLPRVLDTARRCDVFIAANAAGAEHGIAGNQRLQGTFERHALAVRQRTSTV